MIRVCRFVTLLLLFLVQWSENVSFIKALEPVEQQYYYGEFLRLETLYRETWNQKQIRFEEFVLLQGDGAPVTWIDGAYALPAYLDMYQWSHERIWLERFVTRSQQLTSLMWDADDDGYKSWPTANYSANLIGNGGFEQEQLSWHNIVSSLVKHTPDEHKVLLFSSLNETCKILMPSAEQGDKFVSLSPTKSISQTISLLPNRTHYALHANLKIPNSMHLHVIATETGASSSLHRNALDIDIIEDETKGPEGWQFWAQVITTTLQQSLTITLSAQSKDDITGTLGIDNVKLAPYEEYIDDFAMASAWARFAVMVQHSPSLTDLSPTALQFQHMAELIVLKWQPYWRELNDSRGIYIAPLNTSLTIPGQTLPYNMLAMAGLTLVWLAQLSHHTIDFHYSEQAVALAKTIKSSLYEDPLDNQRLLWNYRDPLLPTDPAFTPSIEDISHAGQVVRFINAMHQYGQIFDERTLDRVAYTIASGWNGSTIHPDFKYSLDRIGLSIPLSLGMPYYRHLEIGDRSGLQQATEAAWGQAQNHIACQAQAKTTHTGRHLSSLSLLLLNSNYKLFFPVISSR